MSTDVKHCHVRIIYDKSEMERLRRAIRKFCASTTIRFNCPPLRPGMLARLNPNILRRLA